MEIIGHHEIQDFREVFPLFFPTGFPRKSPSFCQDCKPNTRIALTSDSYVLHKILPSKVRGSGSCGSSKRHDFFKANGISVSECF